MENITIYQLIQWKHAIRLEAKGMKHSSGRSVTAHAKRQLGIRGSREKVLAHVEALVEYQRLRERYDRLKLQTANVDGTIVDLHPNELNAIEGRMRELELQLL